MSFRKKLEVILEEKPDILIIPESENPEKFNYEKWTNYSDHKPVIVDFKIK